MSIESYKTLLFRLLSKILNMENSGSNKKIYRYNARVYSMIKYIWLIFHCIWARCNQEDVAWIHRKTIQKGLNDLCNHDGYLLNNIFIGKILMLGKIDGKRIRGWQRMRWLDGITDLMDSEFKQTLGHTEL